MGCLIMKIEKIEERIDALEKSNKPIINKTIHDKPRLAGAIYFAAFTALFITGLLLGFHWGWLTAIGVVGLCVSINISDGNSI